MRISSNANASCRLGVTTASAALGSAAPLPPLAVQCLTKAILSYEPPRSSPGAGGGWGASGCSRPPSGLTRAQPALLACVCTSPHTFSSCPLGGRMGGYTQAGAATRGSGLSASAGRVPARCSAGTRPAGRWSLAAVLLPLAGTPCRRRSLGYSGDRTPRMQSAARCACAAAITSSLVSARSTRSQPCT